MSDKEKFEFLLNAIKCKIQPYNPEKPGCKENLYIDYDTGTIYIWNGTSYVSSDNEIVFGNNFAAFPVTGAINVLYIDKTNGRVYIWDGAGYITYPPDPELVELRLQGNVLLSGGYFNGFGTLYAGSGTMNTTLDALTLLPATEPYTNLGYNVTETTSNYVTNGGMVDWILVELRDKNDPKIIRYSKPCLIDGEGNFKDASDNDNGILFSAIVDDDYYIAIKHRNHFGVMSATAQDLTTPANFKSLAYNLYQQDDTHYTFDLDGHRALTSGKYMVAGFTAISGQYSPYTEVWRAYNALAYGYLPADFNLDGSIDLIEHSFWEGFKRDSVGTSLVDNKAVDYVYDPDNGNNEGIVVERIPELHKGWIKQIINNDAFGGLQVPLYEGVPSYVWAEGTMIWTGDKLLVSDGITWKEATLV